TDHLSDIDAKVHAVDLSSHATKWWQMLSTPIQLGEHIWLLLGPEQLSIGRVAGRSKVLTVPVSLRARPRIVTGSTEPPQQFPALPPLGKEVGDDGFHIAMDGIVDYGTAS